MHNTKGYWVGSWHQHVETLCLLIGSLEEKMDGNQNSA
jgi:hypothetical protein